MFLNKFDNIEEKVYICVCASYIWIQKYITFENASLEINPCHLLPLTLLPNSHSAAHQYRHLACVSLY